MSPDGDVENIVQMKPQEVNLTLRIRELQFNPRCFVFVVWGVRTCVSKRINVLFILMFASCILISYSANMGRCHRLSISKIHLCLVMDCKGGVKQL